MKIIQSLSMSSHPKHNILISKFEEETLEHKKFSAEKVKNGHKRR
jgi:hypothetical protein